MMTKSHVKYEERRGMPFFNKGWCPTEANNQQKKKIQKMMVPNDQLDKAWNTTESFIQKNVHLITKEGVDRLYCSDLDFAAVEVLFKAGVSSGNLTQNQIYVLVCYLFKS
jgi:hypothetical protein